MTVIITIHVIIIIIIIKTIIITIITSRRAPGPACRCWASSGPERFPPRQPAQAQK